MPPDVTLVTGCFDLSIYNQNSRDLATSIQSMRTLLEIPIYLVIFCDSTMLPHIQAIRNNEYNLANYTQYEVTDITALWAYQYIDIVKKNREHYHPTKDVRTCAESHILCCNKFDFVLQTMNRNPFYTSKFGWIDANIGTNASKICSDYSLSLLPDILQNVGEKFRIQILNVTDKKFKQDEHLREYYNQYRWVVCGCLFTTGKEIGNRILHRLKEVFVETTKSGYGHGEEMLYLSVFDDFYNDIDRSYGDYHHILNNFIYPTKGFDYILHCIINNYIEHSYMKEAYDCCKHVLTAYKDQQDGIWFHIMFKMYLSCYYHKREDLDVFMKLFTHSIRTNVAIRKEFEANRLFYLSQFAFFDPKLAENID